MTERSHETRISVLETKVADNAVELERARARLHSLESERYTIRLLVEQTKALGEQIKELANNSEKLAKRCAKEAMEALMEHKDELAARHSGVHVGLITAAVVVATFLSNIVTHLWK